MNSDFDSSTNDIDSSTNEIAELVDAMKEQAAAKNKTSLLAPQDHEKKTVTKSNEEFDLEEAVTALIPGQGQNTKQSQIETKKSNNSNNLIFNLKIICILFIAIALIYFIFFYRRDDTFVINLPIPYVYYQPYLQSLETFAHLDCHNEFLIVTGPKGIGKSRGISTLIII